MKQALEKYRKELESIREAGTWKGERIIVTPQKSRIDTTEAKMVVNMCANNYLGLSNRPELIEAAKASYDKWGFGLSSVRFICGTQSVHKELEQKLSKFLGMDDTILYSSCFDANGGLFETLLGPEDAVISDELNHASIIDGVRLCKAKRFRYKNNNMEDLRAQLEAAVKGTRAYIFVMLGLYAGLRREEICGLKWNHVDLEQKVITIAEARTTVNGRPVNKSTKNRSSIRRLGYAGLADIEELMERLWRRRQEDVERLGDDYEDGGYVICHNGGRPYQADYLSNRLQRVLSKTELPYVTLHGLRHSFASIANSQKVPLFGISRALGHSNTNTTSRIYMHLFDDTHLSVVQAVGEAVGTIGLSGPMKERMAE